MANKAIVDIRLRPRCAIPPPLCDHRLVQRLQSSVCPCRVPLHGPVQYAIIRVLLSLPLRGLSVVTHTEHTVPQAKPTHQPKWHLDRFSRFRMGPKCYALSMGRNPPKLPIPLGPEEDRSTVIGNIHKQLVACRSRDILAERQTDREIHRHTNHNTCAALNAPLTGACKATNASFVIPCFR